MAKKLWQVSEYDKERAARLAQECDIDPFAALLGFARGLTDADSVRDFFDDSLDLLEDPYNLPDMDKAVVRIEKAIDRGEKILIFGDYDADGITSTAVLQMYLESRGALVSSYIPDRITEGYGLNLDSAKAIVEMNVNLLITVDNGISALEEAEFLARQGVELIITDHHKPGKHLPKAVAVVDPHRHDSKSKFKEYAGVGVVFNLVCALEGGVEEFLFDEFGDLLAVGTIGDVVPLIRQNRIFVKAGLRSLNNNRRIGISALLEEASVEKTDLSAKDVAFRIVPRLNAVGRLGSPTRALQLLLTEEPEEARRLASEIEVENSRRKEVENEIMEEIRELLDEKPELVYDRIIVIDGENWHTGVLGIIASRFTEKYGRPCIVISKDGETARGSGRSLEGFSLFDALSAVSDGLTHFGGHTLAAGLGLLSEKVDEFRENINNYAAALEMPYPVERVDIKINPSAVSLDLLEAINMFEPFGSGNSAAVLGLFGMTIQAVFPLSQGRHTKIQITKNGKAIDALLFNRPTDRFEYKVGDKVDLAVELSSNEFRNKRSISVLVKNIKFSFLDDQMALDSLRLYEKYFRGEILTPKEGEFLRPSRELFAALYRHLGSLADGQFDYERFCELLRDRGTLLGPLKIAFEAFEELELINISDDNLVSVQHRKEKVELLNASSLKRLDELTIIE